MSDLYSLFFLLHIRPSLTYHWDLLRLVSGSLKTHGLPRERRPPQMWIMLTFTNSSTTATALMSWLQNLGSYNLLSISQCGYPVVTLLLLASLRSEGFRGRKYWCGREMRRRKWVNVWESGYSTRRFPSLYTGFPTGGASMATTHKNGEWTWKVKAPREDSKRGCCRRTSEITNLSQHTTISPRRGDGRWGLSA